MKKLILSLIAIVYFSVGNTYATDAMWDRANALYVEEQYQEAVAVYDSLLVDGNTSHKLLYNLANAHFKLANIGQAVLYYNKALKLEPSDADTKHNLAITNTYVKDKIEVVPVFILTQWVRSIRSIFGSNTWAVLALVLLAIALALVVMYLLSKNTRRRKLGFFGAIICLFFTFNCLVFSNSQRVDILRPSSAVIMKESVSVKSSPNKTSTDIFVIHEGTVVKVVQRMGNWSEIIIADGNKGWVERSVFKMI